MGWDSMYCLALPALTLVGSCGGGYDGTLGPWMLVSTWIMCLPLKRSGHSPFLSSLLIPGRPVF